jgi:hypothetical protein
VNAKQDDAPLTGEQNAALGFEQAACCRDGRCRVASDRLEHQLDFVRRAILQLVELVNGLERVLGVRDDQAAVGLQFLCTQRRPLQ